MVSPDALKSHVLDVGVESLDALLVRDVFLVLLALVSELVGDVVSDLHVLGLVLEQQKSDSAEYAVTILLNVLNFESTFLHGLEEDLLLLVLVNFIEGQLSNDVHLLLLLLLHLSSLNIVLSVEFVSVVELLRVVGNRSKFESESLLFLGAALLQVGNSLLDSKDEGVEEVKSEEGDEDHHVEDPAHLVVVSLGSDEALAEQGQHVDGKEEDAFVDHFQVVGEFVGVGLADQDVGSVHHGEGHNGSESHGEVLLEQSQHEEGTSGQEHEGVHHLATSGVGLEAVDEGTEVGSHEFTLEDLLVGLHGEKVSSEADNGDQAAEYLEESADSSELLLGGLVLVEASESHNTELEESGEYGSDDKVEYNQLLHVGNHLLDSLVAGLSEASADEVSDTADSNDSGDEHQSEGRSVGGQVLAELSSRNLSENLVV